MERVKVKGFQGTGWSSSLFFIQSFYEISKRFKQLVRHLGYHFPCTVKHGVVKSLLLLWKETLLGWETQASAWPLLARQDLSSVRGSSLSFPGGDQSCIKCHYRLGTQKGKTNRGKHWKGKSECNGWCCSHLKGENKLWQLFSCLSSCPFTIPALGQGSVFFFCSTCAPCACPIPHALCTLLL